MIRLESPEWLLLLVPLAAAGWWWPRLALHHPLRALTTLLCLLLLAGPEARVRSEGLDLWILVDRSASAEDSIAERLDEWRELVERSRSPGDRVHWVGFADQAVAEDETEGARFPGNTALTRTGLAIEYALAARDSGRSARILVLTDGHATEPIAALGRRLRDAGVPLDYRLLPSSGATDYRVAALRVPPRVSVAEPFLVELELRGTRDDAVDYTVLRDGVPLHADTARLERGVARLRFTDRVARGGAHRYEVRIAADADTFAGNDRAERFVDVTAGPRVLVVTSYRDDPVVAVLREAGFEVEAAAPDGSLAPGRLAGARAVLLNDVPAHRLGGEFLSALDFFVREQGGGLLMVGGRSSFGAGGYFESQIDALLPVSMELREEHRKLAVAMAIVMDRSGSMGAVVQSRGRVRSKMHLANAGAARAIELLGDADLVTVFAVDSEAHEVVGLTEVGAHRRDIDDAVRRIASDGGGIFVYTGMSKAWSELSKASFGQRHLLLFADAADAEEPGEYARLVGEMVAADATVSVIGLGSRSDVDAPLLEDIATRGGGRSFFAESAADLPAVFAQETVALARSAFIDDPTAITDTGAWLELAPRTVAWPSQIDGYNLSYLRPGASAAALTRDDDAAPLVAFWQRGAGRVAAVSFPLAGPLSRQTRAWSGYRDFTQTLTNWLMGSELPRGLGLSTHVDGSQLQLDLFVEPDLELDAAREPPRIVLMRPNANVPEQVVWQREAPGHLTARVRLDAEGFVRGAVQTAWGTLPFGPLNVGSSAEWAFDPRRPAELATLAAESGGGERVDLEDVWQAPRPPQFADLSRWLLIALILLLVADVLRDRLGR